MATNLTIKFSHEKETKNTHVFAEDAGSGSDVVGKLYVQKSALGDEVPDKITVTIKGS